jgi:hypothetical protein
LVVVRQEVANGVVDWQSLGLGLVRDGDMVQYYDWEGCWWNEGIVVGVLSMGRVLVLECEEGSVGVVRCRSVVAAAVDMVGNREVVHGKGRLGSKIGMVDGCTAQVVWLGMCVGGSAVEWKKSLACLCPGTPKGADFVLSVEVEASPEGWVSLQSQTVVWFPQELGLNLVATEVGWKSLVFAKLRVSPAGVWR